MFLKDIMPLGVMLLIFHLGCNNHQVDVGWQQPRPLGRDLRTSIAAVQPIPAEKYVRLEEPTGTINQRQALALALMHNPDLKAFSWNVRASEARTLQAGLRANPELEAEIEEFGGSGELSGFDTVETVVQLSYLIELGGTGTTRKEVAALETELAGWDYEIARLDILTQTVQAFMDVLATQETVDLNEELVKLGGQVFNTVKAQVEAGKIASVESTRAQVEFAKSRIALETSRHALEEARLALAAMWASTSANFERVEGQFETPKLIPTAEQLAQRVSQNPDIARWTTEMAQRRASIQLEKSDRIPDLSIGSGMKYLNEIDEIGLIFALSFPLPLFNRNSGAIREAQYNLAKGFEERKSAEVAARMALARAYSTLSAITTSATTLKDEVLPAAQRDFDALAEGYRLGKFDFLEMLDAQRTLIEVRGVYIGTLAEYHKAISHVERLIAEPLGN